MSQAVPSCQELSLWRRWEHGFAPRRSSKLMRLQAGGKKTWSERAGKDQKAAPKKTQRRQIKTKEDIEALKND